MIGAGITVFFYCKYENTSDCSKTFLYFGIKRTLKKLKQCSQTLHNNKKGSPKIKESPEKVREMLKMLGMDFSDVAKYKACRNSNDRSKIATTSV